MRFTNIPDEDMKISSEEIFSMKGGRPAFGKKWASPVNAREFAQELIQHTYRQGWTLPAMPA
jgi:hypothetical protein